MTLSTFKGNRYFLGFFIGISSTVFFAGAALGEDESLPMEGLPSRLLYIYTQAHTSTAPSDSQQQLYALRRRWDTGRMLRVCLFNGNPVVARLIRDVASEWNAYSSTKFDFGPVGSWYNCLSPKSGFFQVRIGFNDQGYWSAVGNDSEGLLDAMEPSMNLATFNHIYSPSKFSEDQVAALAQKYHKAVIRHEFGHALGLLHEHQDPKLKCTEHILWTGANNVYDYFKTTNDWDEDQVNRNLGFIHQTDPDYQAGTADPKSIMMYSLPREIFDQEAVHRCAVGTNYEISQLDKEIIKKIYGANAVASVNDENLRSAIVKSVPRVMAPTSQSDFLERTLVDLDSNDVFVRRDARARLADSLDERTEGVDVDSLISRMKDSSYRYKLGVSVAIAKSKLERDNLSDESLQKLKAEASKTSDKTLKDNLQSVLQKNHQ